MDAAAAGTRSPGDGGSAFAPAAGVRPRATDAHAVPAVIRPQDEALLPEERREVDRMRRRGERADALDILDEVLGEAPGDAWSRLLRARCLRDLCTWDEALAEAERTFTAAEVGGDRELLAAAARLWAELLVDLGRPQEALGVLDRAGAALAPAQDARDAWALGRALGEAGRRAEAREAYLAGSAAAGPPTWNGLFARARCERALGFFERAARSLVEADKLAEADDGTEPDVLAELGSIYFEVYGEIDDRMSRSHLPSEQYREALALDDEHEATLLGLFELYRFNWYLSRESPPELIERLLDARPDSIRGLLARASADLDDGRLVATRASLERLAELAPGRRDVRAEQAALAWVEHDRGRTEALLGELAEEDPGDSRPDRIVAEHLNELYRSGEALPFAKRATERDAGDWLAWTEYGRALANTGDEDGAREALARADEAAEGRRDAWRLNTARILGRMAAEYVEHEAGEHTFVWMPDAAEILETYFVPFYAKHRAGLAERYGHTPGPVRIEVFRAWGDFSVRSVGFEGFSALGVCFGPVVTVVSPLAELRGGFSWARTAYHEYTHVVHLSLSHNRCPRWITEGLATWEEEEANPAWSRNMRADLLNAVANDALIPVRELNRAFRGPRILFAYFQGGLLCRMLIEDVGFAPMIRLLLAFDRGLTLDEAFDEVLGTTPEEVDARFRAFARARVAELELEPLWNPSVVLQKRLGLKRTPPEGDEARRAWQDEWITVGWGTLQQGRRVDAEEALRMARLAGELPPRGHFLAGDLANIRLEPQEARGAYERGLEAGGEDFRIRMSLGEMALAEGDAEAAEAHFLAAEAAFPGIQEPMTPAELRLAELYALQGETDRSMDARRRWLAFNAGESTIRMQVAAWLDEQGRFDESVELYREANEVDPFHRVLHHRWAVALQALDRHDEALRELDVALKVPFELDADVGPEPDPDRVPPEALEQVLEGYRDALAEFLGVVPELEARRALSLEALGRPQDAREAAQRALSLDPDESIASGVLARLP